MSNHMHVYATPDPTPVIRKSDFRNHYFDMYEANVLMEENLLSCLLASRCSSLLQ